MTATPPEIPLPVLVQDFFCRYLIEQRALSPRTVNSYRDTFRLMLRYWQEKTRKPVELLSLGHFDASTVLGFLNHLEKDRKNTVRSRNARLAAIRTFMRYASLRNPVSLPETHQVLAIPMKRFDRPPLTFLSRQEIDAILSAPDVSTWSGRRDRVMLATLYNTGARVSEVISLHVRDVSVDGHAFVQLYGKGRKQRAVPLWKSTASQIRAWLRANNLAPDSPLFPNRGGAPMSRTGVENRLARAVRHATAPCPSLKKLRISPHSIRHTTALHLLKSGVDLTVVAMWLGHESVATTHQYVDADLKMKEAALRKLQPVTNKRLRYRPRDRLLAFLDGL
jgi:site-specific recombinase XerD